MTPWLHRVWFALLVAAIAVTLSVAVLAVRNRETDAAPALAVTAVAIAIWLLGDLGAMLATSTAASARWVQVLWIGVAITPAATFVLVARYTGRDRLLTDGVLAGLALAALAMIAVALTHGAHDLLWRSVNRAPETPIGIAFDHGPAFYAYVGYAYVLTAAATLFVAQFSSRSTNIYRGQAAALTVGIFAPWAASAMFVFGATTFDPSSVAFTVTAAAFGVAIVRYRFVDVMPVARETIVDAIDDGVFVLDRRDRIVDVNSRGRRLLDADGAVVGRNATDVFPEPIASRDEGHEADDDEVAVETGRGTRYLATDETVIADRRDRPIGRLFIVRDVTERRQYERELERQNERLDRFASVVSHDLRNPLNVADGYSSILADRYDDPAVDKIDASLDRMEAIIEDVLALARHGDVVSDPADVELAAPVERAWNGVETGAATLRIETGDHTVSTDESRLVQALENLFRNSVEHGSTSSRPKADDSVEHGSTSSQDGSRPDDSVEHGSTSPDSQARRDSAERGPASPSEAGDSEAAVERGGSTVTVTVGVLGANGSAGDGDDGPGSIVGFYVADDGVGIPADERAAVFEPGYTTNADGTGLGLDIVTQIVEAHGWTIAVAESDDGGARFEIRFERERAAGGESASIAESDDGSPVDSDRAAGRGEPPE